MLWSLIGTLGLVFAGNRLRAEDYVYDLQNAAIQANRAEFGHWGPEPANYKAWATHSNRLIPVYTFGTMDAGPAIDLRSYQGSRSPYRSAAQLRRIYGREPGHTLDPAAEFFDQTDLFRIQEAAIAAGKKHVFLVIFDGMDWQTTRAAAIHRTQKIAYTSGRGTGLHFQDYTADGTTQFGFMCTSPHNNGTKTNVNHQTVSNPGGTLFGGYNIDFGGPNPWTPGRDILYLIAANDGNPIQHAYTDSSSSATSMTAGIKTYNNGVNVDFSGQPIRTIAHMAQELGYAVGAVTSVPISHATPAATYAHNVHRDDYQDLTRDMLGRKSISHPVNSLAGMEVVIGGGAGDSRTRDGGKQTDPNADDVNSGDNFISGNVYLTESDLHDIDVRNGGKYVVAIRESGVNGRTRLREAAEQAALSGHRMLGFYGNGKYSGHLPFETADGDFHPAIGRKNKAEDYDPADLAENPTLAEMTSAAIQVLSKNPRGFWLMVEAGDVDWANHDNNIDNSIGAVNSGEHAVRAITDWVDQNSNWKETIMIVTADHGHYLILEKPELLINPMNR